MPEDFDIEEYRGRADWQYGKVEGEARIEVAPTRRGGSRAYDGRRNRIEGDTFVTEYASLPLLARWIIRQDGRAVPLAPPALRRLAVEGARAARTAHDGLAPETAAPDASVVREAPSERPSGPVAPERFGVLQSLLAYLLTACGEAREAVIPAAELVERFSIPEEALEEHLSL
jgi:hypothetical protein